MLWANKGLQTFEREEEEGDTNNLWLADDNAIPGGRRGEALRFPFSSHIVLVHQVL